MPKTVESGVPTDAEIVAARSKVDQTLASLHKLSEKKKITKNQDIKEMIRYYNATTKNIEDRRIQIANFSWQTSAVVITALGLTLSIHMIAILKIPLLILLATILAMSFLKIREYHVQSQSKYIFRRYPEFENNWKWFYYGNKFMTDINPNPFDFEKTTGNDRLLYLDAMDLFAGNYASESIDQELQSNLVQLFILQAHNFYKNRFYLRLLDYDLMTPRVLLVLLLIYLIAVASVLLGSPPLAHWLFTQF